MSLLETIEEKLEALEAEIKAEIAPTVAEVETTVEAAPAEVEAAVVTEIAKHPNPIIQMAINQAAERLARETGK